MSKNYSYAIEKLTLVKDILAIGKGDIRSRLIEASSELFVLEEDHFPENLKKEFRWILNQMTKYEQSDLDKKLEKIVPRFSKGCIQESMRRINNKAGQKIAHKILEIINKIKNIDTN